MDIREQHGYPKLHKHFMLTSGGNMDIRSYINIL